MPDRQSLLALAGRLALSALFIYEGAIQIPQYDTVAAYMAGYGVSPALLPLVIATELGGGLLVAAGLWTRWAALALAGFCLLTALFFHFDLADADQVVHLFKNLAMAGGFLLLVGSGAGPLSLDHWLAARRGP